MKGIRKTIRTTERVAGHPQNRQGHVLHVRITEKDSRINWSLLKKPGSRFHSKAHPIISLANRQTLTPTVYKKGVWGGINLFIMETKYKLLSQRQISANY